MTDNGTAFVEARIIRAYVVGGLVAGGMLELQLWELLGDAQRLLHVAERGSENQPVALLSKLANHAFRIRPFSNAFDIGRLHLVAEVRLNGLAAGVMTMCPAIIPNRADIDKADLQRLCGPGRHDTLRCDQSSRCCGLQKAAPI